MTCTVHGCARPAKGRGWCKMHHERWRRTGNPLGHMGDTRTCDSCGKHQPENVQTAHFRCNWTKAAGVYGHGEQLRLPA